MNTLLLPPTHRTAVLGFSIERLDRLSAKKKALALRCEREPSERNLGTFAALVNPILSRR